MSLTSHLAVHVVKPSRAAKTEELLEQAETKYWIDCYGKWYSFILLVYIHRSMYIAKLRALALFSQNDGNRKFLVGLNAGKVVHFVVVCNLSNTS